MGKYTLMVTYRKSEREKVIIRTNVDDASDALNLINLMITNKSVENIGMIKNEESINV